MELNTYVSHIMCDKAYFSRHEHNFSLFFLFRKRKKERKKNHGRQNCNECHWNAMYMKGFVFVDCFIIHIFGTIIKCCHLGFFSSIYNPGLFYNSSFLFSAGITCFLIYVYIQVSFLNEILDGSSDYITVHPYDQKVSYRIIRCHRQ